MKKIVGSTLDLSTKAVFSLDKYQLKNKNLLEIYFVKTCR